MLLSRTEWGRIYYALGRAVKSARARAGYYRREEARWKSNTPEMEAQRALAEAERLRSLMDKLVAMLGGEPGGVLWGPE